MLYVRILSYNPYSYLFTPIINISGISLMQLDLISITQSAVSIVANSSDYSCYIISFTDFNNNLSLHNLLSIHALHTKACISAVNMYFTLQLRDIKRNCILNVFSYSDVCCETFITYFAVLASTNSKVKRL